jgi:hypothetical protein
LNHDERVDKVISPYFPYQNVIFFSEITNPVVANTDNPLN